ncbi:MAG: MerR family transcriptional regulator [Ignavibacteria bacterium]|nr:MerR family transcriptional regulator [Ignavibacteria bacterium]
MRKNFAMKKLYYSISEVSKITELEQYVLRYWETEFGILKPAKNLAGNRIYTNKDIKLILYIKKLLRDEKYTIEGAKKIIKNLYSKDDKRDEKTKIDKNFDDNDDSRQIKSELSLFQNHNKSSLPQKNVKLKRDLKELRNFLNNLLDEI